MTVRAKVFTPEREEAMRVQCPQTGCLVLAGRVCVTTSGKPYQKLHKARYAKAADRKKRNEATLARKARSQS